MTEKNKDSGNFVKHATILAIAALVSRFIGFLYRVPLTHLIGDVGNGIYADGFTIYSVFFIISSAGLPVAISRMVSSRLAEKNYKDAHKVFITSLIIGGTLGLISCLIMVFGADMFTKAIQSPNSKLTLITLAPTVIIVSILSSFRGYFQGMGNSIPTAFSEVVEQVFNASFSLILAKLFLSRGVDKAAAGATAATGIGAIAGLFTILFIYYLARPNILKDVKADNKKESYETTSGIAKELLKTALPIVIGTAVFSMTNVIDMVTVKNILINSGNPEKSANAAYGLLSGKFNTIATMPSSISMSFATASIPSIASSFKLKETSNVESKINMAMKITMMISIPAAVGIGILGDQLVRLLFPSQPEGGILLTIGSISIVFLALTQITTAMLQGIGQVHIPAIAALCGALIKIPVNFILISALAKHSLPAMQVAGAVIGTSVCNMTASAIDIHFLKKRASVKLNFKTILLKPLIAATLMGFTCYTFYYAIFYLTDSNTIGVLISILISMLTYFVILILIRGITKEDIMLIPMGSKIANFLEEINAF